MTLPDLPVWVRADVQTEGKGRRGRSWSSPIGNFYGTYAFRPAEPPAVSALYSFVAALALRDALVQLTGHAQGYKLKWPNDILLNGGKLSGILLESRAGILTVGIGVNLSNAPDPGNVEPGAVLPVSVFGETGIRISPDQLLSALAPAFTRRSQQLASGFGEIRTDFLRYAARIGEHIIARTGQTSRSGVFRTIDETGALVLATNEGPVLIPAADIFFGEGPHAARN